MEVIYKKGQISLPKNIKQIGTEQDNIKIYIEDYAYAFIKDIKVDEDEDGAVGILLGETSEKDGVKYVFVKGVVEVLNAAVYTDMIAFTQETWPVTKKYINFYFGDYDIVGWYLTSSKITGDNMDIICNAHNESFADEDNVFFMFNPETSDEAFFAKEEEKLQAVTGYNVYYEKNAAMQKYISENQSDFAARYQQKNTPKQEKAEAAVAEEGSYRKTVKEKEAKGFNTNKRNLTLIYALSMLVVIVVLIIGVHQINSYDKLGGNKKPEQEANGTADEYSSKTPITSLEGNVTTAPEETTTTKEEPTTKDPSKETTAEPTTPEPTTSATEYEEYTVKDGDGMWRICVTFYGAYTQEAANRILEFNGLPAGYSLQPGMTLKIPVE